MDIPLGVDVHCTDGRCGRSSYIILNPATEEVTHLVVAERQPSRLQRLVPVRLLEETAAEMILLDCALAEFAGLELFNRTDFVYTDLPHYATDPKLTLLWPYAVSTKRIVDDKIRPIPEGELAVRRGAQVRATDGWIGRVDEFVVDQETRRITHLVLREGHLWEGKDVAIPVSDIADIEERVVRLGISKNEVEALQPVPVKRRW